MTFVPELNIIKKDWRKTDLRIALCYPNVYRAGMSGLTIRLLYALFNVREDVLCERFFIPTLDEQLRSLESNTPLKKFDIVAFTLQYEEDYMNVIKMLYDSGIPLSREDRKKEGPLIIAGGPCATANPEPLADYIDLFVIGDAEPVLNPLIDKVRDFENPSMHISDFADVKGIYVSEISNPVTRVWVKQLDDAPHPLAQQIPVVKQNSPYMTVFGKAFAVEAVRGCARRCRFCLIRHLTQPKRERSLSKVETIIEEGLKYTPVPKLSLIGASIFDYSHLEDLCEFIVSKGLEIAVPSLRPESITERLARLLAKGHQRNVSLAPDAASPRMREVASKQLEQERIVDAAKVLLSNHIHRLKLYFIVGFPGETRDDIQAIADLSKRIADIGYGPRAIHLSVNPLVPKPHTPFQWEKTPSISYVREALALLRNQLKGDNRFAIRSLEPRRAQIQASLSLGDRAIGKVIADAARFGGKVGGWRRAIRRNKITNENNAAEKKTWGSLPWSKIDVGISQNYLLKEAASYKSVIGSPQVDHSEY